MLSCTMCLWLTVATCIGVQIVINVVECIEGLSVPMSTL